MGEQGNKQRLQALEEMCRDRGMPFTVQRRAIFEALIDLRGHPTADQVHAAVSRRHPAISRTTVYRTLETLSRIGAVTKLCHPGSGVRYDSRLEVHHHLVCLRCDDASDISDERLDALPIPDTSAQGFEVSGFSVQLQGICRRCRELEEEP